MEGAAARIASTVAGESFEFQATQIGCLAADTLARERAGRLIAVFDGGFYIQFATELVFLGAADLAIGPLNVVTSAPGATNWNLAGARVGDRAVVTGGCLIVGPRFRFMLGDAPVWRPEPGPETPDPRAVSRGLVGFREAATRRVPLKDVGGVVQSPKGQATSIGILETRRFPIQKLRDWLVQAFRNRETACPADVAALIGLGPGLTPSGDDLLGGAMIAAHALGEGAVGRRLWGMIQPRLDATGIISGAHLRAAADGLGHRDIHRVALAILAGKVEDFTPLIDGIEDIGHSSGWDAVAGVTLTFDAWLIS